ncbi:hypothetical protein [Piscinibacter sp. XHJ-5]|uniref:hypothetical protein n=1 Tax=Piscinibacter sp. XHJ-5 TaxID=3037797 RepID=UPI002452FA4D|nr:hypothetical protein [Piscinibacter sp. XHJ-5]
MPRTTKRGTSVSQQDETRPKLPHERDESAEDQTGETPAADSAATGQSRERMRQGHDDVTSGKQDTDRGPVADATYHKLRK